MCPGTRLILLLNFLHYLQFLSDPNPISDLTINKSKSSKDNLAQCSAHCLQFVQNSKKEKEPIQNYSSCKSGRTSPKNLYKFQHFLLGGFTKLSF